MCPKACIPWSVPVDSIWIQSIFPLPVLNRSPVHVGNDARHCFKVKCYSSLEIIYLSQHHWNTLSGHLSDCFLLYLLYANSMLCGMYSIFCKAFRDILGSWNIFLMHFNSLSNLIYSVELFFLNVCPWSFWCTCCLKDLVLASSCVPSAKLVLWRTGTVCRLFTALLLTAHVRFCD